MKTPTIHTTIEVLSKPFLVPQEARKACKDNNIQTADLLVRDI